MKKKDDLSKKKNKKSMIVTCSKRLELCLAPCNICNELMIHNLLEIHNMVLSYNYALK